MKTMKCNQLGGPASCEETFRAETFEEMARLSQEHGMKMRDEPEHQKAMQTMMDLMKDQEKMNAWMEQKRQEFEALPDEKQ